MSQVILKCSPSEIKAMQAYYNKYLSTKPVQYTTFVAKTPDATITAYNSGKVMFQGANADKAAARWQTDEQKKATAANDLPADFAKKSVIGSDEVGNGSYFGPLVVCAVYASKEHLTDLQKLGVKDSKMLTDQQIRALAPQIKVLVPYQILNVSPEKYNEIQPKYNAVHMKVLLHQQALNLLMKKIAPAVPDAILIDQFTPASSYQKYLKQTQQTLLPNTYFKTKGEQYHLAVAAASILCRAQFLQSLDDASETLGLTVPSGAGDKADQVASQVLRQGGEELLAQHVKLHFANTEKAKKLM